MREPLEAWEAVELFLGCPIEIVESFHGKSHIYVENSDGAIFHIITGSHCRSGEQLDLGILVGAPSIGAPSMGCAIDPEGVVFFACGSNGLKAGNRVLHDSVNRHMLPSKCESVNVNIHVVAEELFFPKDGCPVELLEDEQRSLSTGEY